MAMYHKLLVPLDGSAFGEQALPLALHLARRDGAELHLVYVHVPLATIFAETRAGMETLSEGQLLQRDRNYLAAVVKRLTETMAVAVTSAVLVGPVAPAIEEYARARGIDLVVMTTHGRGAFSRFWLGSVADDLVRRLSMPVLLVRPDEKAAAIDAEVGFHQVIVPLDGTALAEQVLEPAVALAGTTGVQYVLLRVVTPVVQSAYDPGAFGIAPLALPTVEELRREGEAYLEAVAGRLRPHGLRVETAVAVHTQPAVGILEAAQNCGGDLIALETHGRKGVARFFLGSVADKVVRGATVPVLVHRSPVP
jgi:nucleotide-binding universal stress UspA family protein